MTTTSRCWLSSSTSSEKDEKATDAEEQPQQPPEEGAAASEAEEEAAAAEEEDPTEKLRAELQVYKDQLMRAVAEQENIRKIARNDVQAAQQFSIRKFAKSLLDVADNLDRALESVDGTDAEHGPALLSFYQGIELTKTGLVKALESNGVTAYCEQPGEVFDPLRHEALMEYPDPSATPGTVGQVMKKGYMLNGRVLRPAEVAVIKK
jgi:molecular chaperone GrpE